MIEISSKLSAKTALINPINENNIEVKNNTITVSKGFATVKSDKIASLHQTQLFQLALLYTLHQEQILGE